MDTIDDVLMRLDMVHHETTAHGLCDNQRENISKLPHKIVDHQWCTLPACVSLLYGVTGDILFRLIARLCMQWCVVFGVSCVVVPKRRRIYITMLFLKWW